MIILMLNLLGLLSIIHGDESFDLIAETLLNLPPVYKKSTLPACSDFSTKSCQEIEIRNFGIVNHTAFDFPGVDTLYSDTDYSKSLSGQYFSQSFTSDDGSIAVLTSNFGKRSLTGVVNTADGRYFAIEKSLSGKHILIEADPEAFEDEIVVGASVGQSSRITPLATPSPLKGINPFILTTKPTHKLTPITFKSPFRIDDIKTKPLPINPDRFRRQKRQSTEKAVVRIAFYYTKEFLEGETDIEGYVNELVEIANLGFRDSGSNIEVVKYKVPKCNHEYGEMKLPNELKGKEHFIRLSTIKETVELKKESGKLLEEFRKSILGNYDLVDLEYDLEYDYDVAILLYPGYQECDKNRKCSCGAVYETNSVKNRRLNVGIVRKDCGRWRFTLGHNLGEMFGGGQNREARRGKYTNPSFPEYGYAKLLFGTNTRCPTDRTIMSYAKCRRQEIRDETDEKKTKRINGYSNPNVCLVGEGPKVEVCAPNDPRMRTGDANSDNVRVFSENVNRHIVKGKWQPWLDECVHISPLGDGGWYETPGRCWLGQKRVRACSFKRNYLSEEGCEGECKKCDPGPGCTIDIW